MHLARFVAGVLLVAWGSLASACSDDGGTSNGGETQRACAANSQCSSGFDDCEHLSVGGGGLCIEKCATRDDCPDGELCLSSISLGFSAGCVLDCTTTTCPSDLTCVEFDPGVSGCFPADWSDNELTKIDRVD
jgi:hypothetical protein